MLSRTRTTAGFTRAPLAVMVIGAALMLQTGCDSGGATRVVTPEERNAAFTPEREAYTKLGYRHVWTGFPTMTAGARITTLEPLNDVIAVQESVGTLSILESASGVNRWSDQLGNRLTKFLGVARDEKQIICFSETEASFLDTDTGTLVGKQTYERVSNTKPELVGDLMVYGTAGGEVFGQITTHGFRAWGASMPGAIDVDPARLGDTVGFASSTGDIRFFDGRTGSGVGGSQMFRGPGAAPAASAELMFVASLDQSLYAFSPASPAPVWRHRTNVPLTERPVYHKGVVYCTVPGEGLTAFGEYGESGRGEVRWVCKDVFGHVIGLRAGRLLVWDGKDACLVDPAKGDLVERVPLADVSMIATDSFINGNLYVATPQGLVIKLAPR